MQHELESLERRITTLEDDELEVMERLEDAQRSLDSLTAQLADADARDAELEEARDARYAEIDAELDRGSPSSAGPIAAGMPDDLLALYDRLRAPRTASAPPRCGPASAAAACSTLDNAELGRDPGRGRGRGAPLRGVPADPGPHARSRVCERSRRAVRHRGRRRLARQPRPGGVRRRAQGRRHRRGDRRGRHDDRRRQQQRRGVPRPDRRADDGRRARPGRRDRGPDGLQARRRADVRPLEDQAPRHEAAGARGQPAGAVRDDVHLGAARAEQARRPARQRGARRQAERRHRRRAARRRTSRRPRRSTRPSRREPSWIALAAGQVRHHAGPGPARRRPPHTREKRFSGGLASANPGLSDEGRDQIRATADWLAPLAERRRRGGRLARTPHPRVRPRSSPSGSGVASRRTRASPRWSSAPGTG